MCVVCVRERETDRQRVGDWYVPTNTGRLLFIIVMETVLLKEIDSSSRVVSKKVGLFLQQEGDIKIKT